MKKVYSAGLAARSLLGSQLQTHNPTPAASFLLGVLKRAPRGLRRRAPFAFGRFRRRRATSNPVPAVLSSLGSVGLPTLGRKTDPKKMRERAAFVAAVASLAAGGQWTDRLHARPRELRDSDDAVTMLEQIASGVAWPGGWMELRTFAQGQLEAAQSKIEARAEKAGRAAGAVAARRERTEERIFAAGTAGLTALARAGRGSLPRRKRRRRRRTY